MKTSSTSLADPRESFHRTLLAFLWRQWSALGVAGHAASEDPRIIDPDALLLLSTVVARRDARLFDEILDWLVTNGSWISLQRLSRLQEQYEVGEGSILAAIAAHLSRDSAHKKWQILLRKAGASHARDEPIPLFLGIPLLGAADQEFLVRGWQRGPVKLRGMSQPPRLNQPAAFLIKLRALFGRQSSAEIIAWLLAHDSGHPAEIARQLSYFPRSVQAVLNELAFSGCVHAVRAAREKHFAIRKDDWRFLITWPPAIKLEFPRWVQWGPLFRVFRRLNDLFERPGFQSMSTQLQSIEIKRAVHTDPPISAGLLPPSHGADYIASDWLEACLRISQTEP